MHFGWRRIRPRPEVLDTVDATNSFKKLDDGVVFIAYLDLEEDRSSAGVFEDVWMRYRDEFSFGLVGDREVARGMGVETPAVVCYKRLDGELRLEGPLEVERLGEWWVCPRSL